MTLKEIQSMPVDENGIVTIELDGKERRFLKEKLVSYLERNDLVKTIKHPVIKKEVKREPRKTPKKQKVKRGVRGEHKRVPIIAIMPDGIESVYVSCHEASVTLGVNRMAISRCINGKSSNKNGIKFKIAG